MEEPIKHPAWRHALEILRREGLTYGLTIKAERLAELLRADVNTPQFQFGMIELRRRIEMDDGYYLACTESGAAWKIIEADSHEDQARTFDTKVRRYAVRSVNLRSATLMNPDADLKPEVRASMERNLEHAATRLALISRRNSTPLPPK